MSDQPEPIKPDPAKKPKRPADMNQRAKMIVDLATGEAEESSQSDEAKAEAGQKGGDARSKKLTSQERSEIARRAAQARWKSA